METLLQKFINLWQACDGHLSSESILQDLFVCKNWICLRIFRFLSLWRPPSWSFFLSLSSCFFFCFVFFLRENVCVNYHLPQYFILSSLFIFDSDLFLFLCFRRWHSLQPRQFIYPQNQPVCNHRVINTNWILQQSLTTLLTTPMTCSGNAMKWLQLIIILIIVLTNFTLYIAQRYTVDMT